AVGGGVHRQRREAKVVSFDVVPGPEGAVRFNVRGRRAGDRGGDHGSGGKPRSSCAFVQLLAKLTATVGDPREAPTLRLPPLRSPVALFAAGPVARATRQPRRSPHGSPIGPTRLATRE